MTLVVGTAGHIDHGKTTLLRALTGIDADRLPEERRRGMTIDVGYAHLRLDDGSEIDFVDVPGHDRLVGNMLVGAGEIDVALLVVAADDGPRAQTLEHLALLDALGVDVVAVAVTKIDVVDAERLGHVVEAVRERLGAGGRVAPPILAVSGTTGEGVVDLRETLVRAAVRRREPVTGEPMLAIDRVFSVKGRGVVVTGTLRGGALGRGATLRLAPGEMSVRVREIQVHGSAVESARPGRTALNLAGIDADALHRGQVLTSGHTVVAASRLLVALGRPWPDRARARLHLGTAAADATIGRSGRDGIDLADGTAIAILRLSEPVAAAPGERFVLRRSGGAEAIAGGTVLDTDPPRGLSRRRQTVERVGPLAAAVASQDIAAIDAARLDLHGALRGPAGLVLAPDVLDSAVRDTLASIEAAASLAVVRSTAMKAVRRTTSVRREDGPAAAAIVIDALLRDGRAVRDGDVVRRAGTAPAAVEPALAASMDRLEAALAVSSPPSLAEAARVAACPPAGIRALERAGRVVLLEPDLAYAMSTYRDLAATALRLAAHGPLTPAAYRDATGTSRKYVMAILEDLDRRAILRRTPDGHVPGPRAPRAGEP